MRLVQIFLPIFIFCHLAVNGQEIGLKEVSVILDESPLELPSVGGLKAPQFSMIDLNLDGIEDLFVFDRDGNVILPFINDDGRYRFAPEFRSIFPKFNSWVLLRDYDNDGIKDALCSPITVGIPGVQVYKGVIRNGTLAFDLIPFPERDFDILYVPLGRSVTQIYVSPIDLPDIRDTDGDGDLDIVAFEPSGSTIYFYRNMSIEENIPLDSLVYTLEETCYGGMVESGFSEEVSLSPDLGVCASSLWRGEELIASSRHAGSTVTSFDLSGNHAQELLLGDISYNGIVRLENTGTSELAHFTSQVGRFPVDATPVNIELYLGAFVEDVDLDGKMNVIISPNERFGSQTKDHVWLYDINRDENGSASFELLNKNFLVDQMASIGTNTAPVFQDINGNGLLDLLVGTNGASLNGIDVDPRIMYFQNIGDKTNPIYKLENDDFLEMSSFSSTSNYFAPSFGDVDGDGDTDVVIGDNVGRLYYVENLSQDNNSFNFAAPVYQKFGIKVSAFARPEIYDFNKDGLGDLIIGEQNFNSSLGIRGSINYFENIGSIGEPMFNNDVNSDPNNAIWGRINLKESGFINNYSAPVVIENGSTLLIGTGSDQGFFYIYETDAAMPSDSFSLVSAQYGQIREGAISALSLADIDDDQYFEMVVGSRRGGFTFYNTDIKVDFESSTSAQESLPVTIFPNPATDFIYIEESDLNAAAYQIFDIKGAFVLDGKIEGGRIVTKGLSNGTYVLRVYSSDIVYQAKIQVIHP